MNALNFFDLDKICKPRNSKLSLCLTYWLNSNHSIVTNHLNRGRVLCVRPNALSLKSGQCQPHGNKLKIGSTREEPDHRKLCLLFYF